MRLVRCDCCGIQADKFEGFKNYKLGTNEDGSPYTIDACSHCRALIDKAMKIALFKQIEDLQALRAKFEKVIYDETNKV